MTTKFLAFLVEGKKYFPEWKALARVSVRLSERFQTLIKQERTIKKCADVYDVTGGGDNDITAAHPSTLHTLQISLP